MDAQPSPQDKTSYSVYEGKFSYWKAAVLAGLYVISSFLVGYLLNRFLYEGEDPFARAAIGFSITVIIFLVMFLLNVVSVVRGGFLSAVLGIGALAMGVNFLGSFNERMLLAVGVLAASFVAGGLAGRREMDDALKIRFFRLSRVVLVPAVFGIAICVAILFFDAFSLRNLTGENPILPQGVFEKNVEGFSRALGPALGDIDFSKTLREIADASVEKIAQDAPVTLGPDVLRASKEQALKEYRDRIEDVLKTPLNPDEKLSTEIYNSLLRKFNQLEGGLKTIILVAFAFILFITVAAISPILRVVAAGIAFLLFELLRATGFVAVVFENRSKETITLP